MNFLAHLYLSGENEELLIGNFIADFIRNRDLVLFPRSIVDGIRLHRHIDHYTDTHPVVVESTRKLRINHGKYAPVVIDVFYDYVLSRYWDRYSQVSLRNFADDTYEVLNNNLAILPIHLQDMTLRMIADDFLLKYGTKVGMERTFRRIGKRAKFASNFSNAFEDLSQDYESIAEGFNLFFPEMIQEVANYESA